MLVLSWLKQCLNSAWHIRHENLKPQDVQGTWNQRVAPSLRVPGKPWYCPLTFPQKLLWAPGQRSTAAGLGGSVCLMESVPAKLGASPFPLLRAGQQTGKLPDLFQNSSSQSLPSSWFVVVCLNLRLPAAWKVFLAFAALSKEGSHQTSCTDGQAQPFPLGHQQRRHRGILLHHLREERQVPSLWPLQEDILGFGG